jgi:MoxR-like ATPase
MSVLDQMEITEQAKWCQKRIYEIESEVSKVVIGQKEVVRNVMKCMMSNGHALLEGVPGLAKTVLIRTLAETMEGAEFKRIQFTPDLLPADLLGVQAYHPEKGFYTIKGPIFANFVLADEVNRSPPKVQSALLEAMQERYVTIGKEDFPLPNPFLVLATQNPLETLGTYPLPEAQLDRFVFKILVYYPSKEDELKILENNLESRSVADFGVKRVIKPEDIAKIQALVRSIHISQQVKEYVVDIVNATRFPKDYGISSSKYVEIGASPRASIYITVGAKATAVMDGRTYVIPEDVKSVVHEICRHRMLINYEGKAEGIKTDDVIDEILAKVPVP